MIPNRAAVSAAVAVAVGLGVYVAARGLQGTLWVLARAAHSPRWLPAAREALASWLNDPTGATR
ncbi:hypothetical protein [Nonomuraea aridisoli]|uniref:Uncharacterized protein n=1 Tax=Nonomuraea aridisoli TaxID=2070368 RepID=A0A2W2FB38_9ACTN|nr:hypothetical protein [Nonomuraea aridisoli]PZG12784.1 hypothetical protein C1J01_31820 [Nonomuraea aridisoli]